jgi:hypothetical protein
LVTRIDAIRQEPDAVRHKLQETVEEVTGGRPFPQVAVWPTGPVDVRTGSKLTLVVLALNHAWGASEREQSASRAFIQGILKSAGNTFRQLKNTLALVLPTVEGVRLMEDAAVQLLALEAIHRQYRPAPAQERGAGRRGGGLSETQVEDLETRLDRARKGLPGAVWGAYTVIIAPTGRAEANEAAEGETTLWVRQEHGFPGYRPGEHSLAGRVWKRLMDDQRLLDRLDPRLISEGKGDQWRLWPAEEDTINVATLWDYFCRFPYLPMLTGPEALQNTISWGVQRGLFAYALGDGKAFDTIRIRESLPSGAFEIIEGAWLLRPALAERLTHKAKAEPPPVLSASAPPRLEEREGPPQEESLAPFAPSRFPTPLPLPAIYRRVTIETPVDWRQWYDFYQSVVRPLVESGADVTLQLRLEATDELDVNLVDLSVRESVMQLNARGRVTTE